MDLLQFTFNHAAIRGLQEEGEQWFVATDVAAVLGYLGPPGAFAGHCTGAPRWLSFQLNGGTQQLRLMNKDDVVRVIVDSFSSVAPERERSARTAHLCHILQNWNGGTSNSRELLNDPAVLCALVDHFRERNSTLELQAAERVHDAEDLQGRSALAEGLSLSAAANKLQMSPQDLIVWMQENGWVYQLSNGDWAPHPSQVLEGNLF